jgi:hypothetical protein
MLSTSAIELLEFNITVHQVAALTEYSDRMDRLTRFWFLRTKTKNSLKTLYTSELEWAKGFISEAFNALTESENPLLTALQSENFDVAILMLPEGYVEGGEAYALTLEDM